MTEQCGRIVQKRSSAHYVALLTHLHLRMTRSLPLQCLPPGYIIRHYSSTAASILILLSLLPQRTSPTPAKELRGRGPGEKEQGNKAPQAAVPHAACKSHDAQRNPRHARRARPHVRLPPPHLSTSPPTPPETPPRLHLHLHLHLPRAPDPPASPPEPPPRLPLRRRPRRRRSTTREETPPPAQRRQRLRPPPAAEEAAAAAPGRHHPARALRVAPFALAAARPGDAAAAAAWRQVCVPAARGDAAGGVGCGGGRGAGGRGGGGG